MSEAATEELLEMAESSARKTASLLAKAKTHEGGLLTVDMLTAKNELRLELSRWR